MLFSTFHGSKDNSRLWAAKIGIIFCLLTTLVSSAQEAHRPSITQSSDPLSEVIRRGYFGGSGTRDRRLIEYVRFLGDDFLKSLAELRSGDHWVDLGSGESYALEDYYNGRLGAGTNASNLASRWVGSDPVRQKYLMSLMTTHRSAKPHLTGITYDGRALGQVGTQIQVLRGSFFEDRRDGEIVNKTYAPPKLMTDLYGVIAYTRTLDVALAKALRLLHRDGVMYVFNEFFDDTAICGSNGIPVPLREWLSSLPGIEIERVTEHTIKIRKTQPVVNIPQLSISPNDLKDLTPPARVYSTVERGADGKLRWTAITRTCKSYLVSQVDKRRIKVKLDPGKI